MKILVIAPQPFFVPRGVPFSVYAQLRALSELGYRADLVTYPLGEPVALPGLRIWRIPSLPFVREVPVGPSLAKLLFDLLLFLWACGRLCSQRYDCICTHEEAGVFGVVLAALFRCRHVYYMHSQLAQQAACLGHEHKRWLLWSLHCLQVWILRHATAVVAICPALEREAWRMGAHGKIYVIENVALPDDLPPVDGGSAKGACLRQVDVAATGGESSEPAALTAAREKTRLVVKQPDARSASPEVAPLLLYTGTLERYQGIELLLKSAVMVRQRCPTVRYRIIGGRQDQVAALQALCGRLGIEECVEFLGQRPPSEMAAALEQATILVSPRCTGTNMPLKLASYLQSGKPLLATSIVAHTQVLNAEVALLVPPTPEGLAAGTLFLLENSTYARALASAARRFAAERWSWPSFVRQQQCLYADVIAGEVRRCSR
ncbi:glycosyltransferase [Thermogemmatispora carboxidivorans]|uniref:glycosyltransferase n=1 Tax=Thermogemmatispora carboxidivorans TaxID=1382306 RepID=UPI0006998AAC|nr:glycosyltransferase [Thermogemmatispora carboxidivorans]